MKKEKSIVYKDKKRQLVPVHTLDVGSMFINGKAQGKNPTVYILANNHKIIHAETIRNLICSCNQCREHLDLARSLTAKHQGKCVGVTLSAGTVALFDEIHLVEPVGVDITIYRED